MKKEDREYLLATIENEGFCYAFVDYSYFNEIKDEEFHRLRKAFIEAKEALEKYIEN